MRFWSDPYLWIHLAGLAALPIFLELCLVGLAIGDPLFPVWLEVFLVAAIGIAPVLWMQWQRPFYIFSIVAVALKPEQLTEDQRRLLTLFRSPRNRLLAAVVAIEMVFVLRWLYGSATIATGVALSSTGGHFVGLSLAAIAFLGANVFLQVPVSVASVMLHADPVFTTTLPEPVEQVRSGFTLFGVQVRQILPPIVPEIVPESKGFVARGVSVPPATIPAPPALIDPPTVIDPPAEALLPPEPETSSLKTEDASRFDD